MNYNQQMLAIFERYRDEVSKEPADLKNEVGPWAIEKGLWQPRPVDIAASFARDMADALQEQVRVDKAGRPYRAKIAARVGTSNGLPLFKWADIDDCPRSHAEKSFQGTRQQMVAAAFHLRMEVDHFNSVHPAEPAIPLLLDLTEDVEEMMIAKGIGKKAA